MIEQWCPKNPFNNGERHPASRDGEVAAAPDLAETAMMEECFRAGRRACSLTGDLGERAGEYF